MAMPIWVVQIFQYLDTLADQIRKGIEAANQELKHESDVRLQQEVR